MVLAVPLVLFQVLLALAVCHASKTSSALDCDTASDETGLLHISRGVHPRDKKADINGTSNDAPADWFTKEVEAIRLNDFAEVFTTQALWDGIQQWDTKNPDNTFFASNETLNQIMLASFLGNVAQETGGLKYPTELAPPDYTTPCTIASGNCAANYGIYFGRGALQVTCWGGAYCAAYSDVATAFGITDMESNPDQVATNPTLAWGSAIVFWMTNAGVGNNGPCAKWPPQNNFGGTSATINGALECPPANTEGLNDHRVANRINNFVKACAVSGLDCAGFTMTCPSSTSTGLCSNNVDWACTWNGDCGISGSCNIDADAGSCAQQAWKCFQDSDCGQSGPCHLPANKGTCQAGGADCWQDGDCQSGSCNLPNLATCFGKQEWGCRKDADCGSSGPCTLNPPGHGTCKLNSDWGCWSTTDCGSSGPCVLPSAGVCDQEAWACRSDTDCGTKGPCWINPAPTGVPGKCQAQTGWKCYSDFDCGKSGPCVAPQE